MTKNGGLLIMLKKIDSKPLHYQTIFKWFLRIFISLSVIFCFALIPLFFYLQNTFTDLQIQKRTQMLNTGVSQISSVASGMLNISESLFSDPRFGKLHYKNIDYETIPISTQNELQDSFESLMFPFSSVSHTALLLNEKVVITDNTVFFNNQLDYYPDCFKVDNLNYDEWEKLLSETGTGFTHACHIKTYSSEYDALVFVTPWTNDTYLYACVDITDIKKMILEKNNLTDCYFTIERIDGTLLYSDLPEGRSDYQTFTEFCRSGELNVSVHIPDSIFYQNMKPLYVFLAVYITACIIILVTLNIIGTKHAVKPILNIIHVLERSRNIKTPTNNLQKNYQDGFEYISKSIMTADQHLEEYQATLNTQQKILQARFLEKAISGQLVSNSEIKQFHSYFPNFPEKYYMLLIRLWTYTTENSDELYSEPLLLVQSFLESELSNIYQQQLNDTELLLIVPAENYKSTCEKLNFMISNINSEEPTYHACCISSHLNHHLENLPLAYRRLRAMDGLSFSDYRTHICTVEDSISESKIPVTMADLMTLYTAITSGNIELSINRLASYSRELNTPDNVSFVYPIFEIMKTMLTYIRLEYPQVLAEQHIPNFQHGKNLYEQLYDVVYSFTTLISKYKNIDKDSFTQELFNYIDTHYTDCDLCLTSLTTHFKCSESTIRKAFKRSTDVTVSRYIEQKRMALANELLAKNELSVTEIALACGFSLPHSFYKAYKRVYGHAPTLPNNVD